MIDMTIKQLLESYKTKQLSPLEVTKEYINRIQTCDSELHTYITVNEKSALNQAKIAEQKIMVDGELLPLLGIPLSYKDNIETNALRTTNGSQIDKDFVPSKNATVVNRLNQAGAINLGKVNLYEYAFGITSDNPFYGTVKNPWNREYMAGGSSSGSAASVAAYLCVGSIGTDTAGSIRVPSSCCGVVGLKPTFNLISTHGVMPLSWTLDHVGPIARNVEDLSFILSALTSKKYEVYCKTDMRGMRIGIPKQYFNERIDEEVRSSYHDAIKLLEQMGAIVIELDMPDFDNPIKVTSKIATAEVGYVHASRRLSSLHLYGEGASEVFKRSEQISAHQYMGALKKKESITHEMKILFEEVDVIVTPTLPVGPTIIGEQKVTISGETESVDDCMIRYTCIFDVTGLPALTIPCGLTSAGLPIGLQFIANHNREDILIHAAYSYEQETLGSLYESRKNISRIEECI